MPSPIIKKMDSMSKRVTDLLPSTKGGILTNKWILYLVLFFAIFDVFHFYQKGDLQSVMIFFIVGILVSFFSKNMVVILIIAIASTHMIRYGKRLTEGFKDDGDEEFADKGEETEEFADETDETEKPKEEFEGETDETEKPKETEKPNTEAMNAINNTSSTVNQMAAEASSVDGISQQTKDLLIKQKTLMENMKVLEPLLSKADTFISNNNKEKFTSLAEAYANHGSVTTKPTSK
jgi:hypothetical protein